MDPKAVRESIKNENPTKTSVVGDVVMPQVTTEQVEVKENDPKR
jgi:hypothetical protein